MGTVGCGEGGLGPLGAVGIQSVSASWGAVRSRGKLPQWNPVHRGRLGPLSLVDGISACGISRISGKKPV